MEYFQVLHGRLVMQHNEKAWKLWHQDVEGNLKKADANWPNLSRAKAADGGKGEVNESFATSLLVSRWATRTNRAFRSDSYEGGQRRLRRAALLTLALLLFLAGRAFAVTNADAPNGKADATIDLATKAGVDLVKGRWRYSDTRIVEVDFKTAGADKQPTGAPIKTYDYEPHAGGADFDDSKWETIAANDVGRASVDRAALFQLVSDQSHDSGARKQCRSR